MLANLVYYVKPLDRPRGRPRKAVAGYRAKWRKPYREIGEYETRDRDSQLHDDPVSVIAPDLVDYLDRAGLPSGWFTIVVRHPGQVFGHVRRFDVFATRGSIFGSLNSCVLARDGSGEPCTREFVPMIGPAPRQRMDVRRIRDASDFLEVANG